MPCEIKLRLTRSVIHAHGQQTVRIVIVSPEDGGQSVLGAVLGHSQRCCIAAIAAGKGEEG